MKVQPNQQNKLFTLRYLTKLIYKYLNYQQKSSNVKNINKINKKNLWTLRISTNKSLNIKICNKINLKLLKIWTKLTK